MELDLVELGGAPPEKHATLDLSSPLHECYQAFEIPAFALTSPAKASIHALQTPSKRIRSPFEGIGASLLKEPSWIRDDHGGHTNCKQYSVEQLHTESISGTRAVPLDVSPLQDLLSVTGFGSTTPCETILPELFNATAGHTPTHKRALSQHCKEDHNTSMSQPLPRSTVDWLVSTQSTGENALFKRPWFVPDCHRRFRELAVEGMETLGIKELRDALPRMFPTLDLDLNVKEHRIPALSKSIPSLIATFDSDSDGRVNAEDFVELMKFCQAWREQFYFDLPPLSRRPNTESKTQFGNSTKWGASQTLSRSCSSSQAPCLDARRSSGFGARISLEPGNKGGEEQLVEKKKARRPRRASSSATKVGPHDSCALLTPERSLPSLEGLRRSSSCAGKVQGSRRSPVVDSSRGAFYSTFLGLTTTPEGSKQLQDEARASLRDIEKRQDEVRDKVKTRLAGRF
jgi:hypothetical protein